MFNFACQGGGCHVSVRKEEVALNTAEGHVTGESRESEDRREKSAERLFKILADACLEQGVVKRKSCKVLQAPYLWLFVNYSRGYKCEFPSVLRWSCDFPHLGAISYIQIIFVSKSRWSPVLLRQHTCQSRFVCST